MRYFIILFGIILPVSLLASIKVVDQSSNFVSVQVDISNLKEFPIEINGKRYSFFQFDGGIVEEEAGRPALPYFSTRLAVPPNANVSYKLAILQQEIRYDTDVVPQSRVYIRGKVAQIPPDEQVYKNFFPYPSEIVQIGQPYSFRGINVVGLKVYPIQYFPGEHRVVIIKKLRIEFNFKMKKGSVVGKSIPISKKELNVLSEKILNYQQAVMYRFNKRKGLNKRSVDYDFSTGKWFRIPIKEEGIYQITGAFLKSKGIDIGSIQLANIHMYNYGGLPLPYNVNVPRPDDLNEIAIEVVDAQNNGQMDEDDKIIFFGRGLGNWQFNPNSLSWEYQEFPYDDTNYYLLSIDNRPGKRVLKQNSPQLPNPEIPTSFTDYFRFEEDRYNILSSGLDWYWLKLSGLNDKKTAELGLPKNLADGQTKLLFRFKGGSGSFYGDNEPYLYNLKAIINGEIVFENYSLSRSYNGTKVVTSESLFALKGGNNLLEIYHKGNLSGCEVYLDFIEITLQRPFIAEDNKLHFRNLIGNNKPVEYRITGMPAGTNVVYDISDFANVKKIEPIQNGQTVIFQDVAAELKAAEYYVFSSESIQDVEEIEPVENHPNLRDPSRKAEFIIITPDEFYDAAQFLEDWRETQVLNPLQTERIRLSEIFLEFSSSVRDVTAIRDFLKYVYENWSDTLQYVLLFGDGHYDYRQILLKDQPNFIPPFEISNISEVDSRETDNYYVAFGMNDNLNNIDPWLPIARLPVNSIEQIDVYREKVEKYRYSYLYNPERNGWQTWVTLVADDQYGGIGSNNEWFHVQPTEELNKKYIPKKFNRTKIYLHDYEQVAGGLGRWKPKATEDLVAQINRGTLLINYFGHGDSDTWAHESVLNRSRDLPKFQNNFRLPLWVAATCTWGKYDDPNHTSMSEELIWLPEKGGIAVISASRPVFVFSNVQFAKDFYWHLFRGKSENLPSCLLGDAIYLAMRGQGSRNYQKFHLYGDPTMRLADPEHVIKIISILPDTLKALSTVTVEAVVTDKFGFRLTNFDGKAIIQCFDAVDSLYIAPADLQYNYHGGTIFKGIVTVEDGYISGSFIVPKSIKYKNAATGRINIYAWNQDTDAVGFVDTLLFFGSESQITDTEGPEIDVSFKEMPDFFDGDFVNIQPTLVVELRDENGINLTGEVGHRIELIIDEKLKKDVTEFFVYETDSYQSGRLEYTLPPLPEGVHQLKISSWDNLNNYSEKVVTFRTSSADKLTLTEVVNFPNPFSNDTYFTFQLVSPVGEAEVIISVYTLTGRKIQEIRDVARPGFNRIYWDGLDWDGDVIANGVYIYKIVVDDGENRVEKIEKLAIVR